MIVFCIPIRHPDHSYDYNATWDTLRKTLKSVCNQTTDRFKVIVVCNKVLDDFKDLPYIKNVEFIERKDWPPPPINESDESLKQIHGQQVHFTGIHAARYDKSVKYLAAILKAWEDYDPTFVMLMDGDDFISKHLAEYCLENAEKHPHGFFISSGYRLKHNKLTRIPGNFHRTCGTSNIMNIRALLSPLDIDESVTYNSSIEKLRNTDPAINGRKKPSSLYGKESYLEWVLGSHSWTAYTMIQKGFNIGTISWPAAIYNLEPEIEHHSSGHASIWIDAQASRHNKKPGELTDKFIESVQPRFITEEQKEEFNLEVEL